MRVPSSFAEAHGRAVLHTAELAGFEGVVAKRLAAPYRPGRRSADWTKVATGICAAGGGRGCGR